MSGEAEALQQAQSNAPAWLAAALSLIASATAGIVAILRTQGRSTTQRTLERRLVAVEARAAALEGALKMRDVGGRPQADRIEELAVDIGRALSKRASLGETRGGTMRGQIVALEQSIAQLREHCDERVEELREEVLDSDRMLGERLAEAVGKISILTAALGGRRSRT